MECTLYEGERWAFTAAYAPATPAQRVRWIAASAAQWAAAPPAALEGGEEELGVLAGDFNCVEDTTVDVFNRPTYRNEGGAALAAALAHEGWVDGWKTQLRKPPGSGMTHWTAGTSKPSGSRLDRVYVTAALRRRVVSTTPVPCPFSDHSAVTTRIQAAGAKKTTTSKRFMVNSEVVKSTEGRRVVQEAIADTVKQLALVTPTERWCKVKLAIKSALRALAIERAEWALQDMRDLQLELEALGKLDFHTTEQRDEYECAKVRLRERETVKAKGAAIRARQRWSEEGERSTKYFLGLERARRAPPGELAVKGVGDTVITGRAKVARAVRKVWADIFTEPTVTSPSERNALDDTPAAAAAARKFRGEWTKALSKKAAAKAQRVVTEEETQPIVARLRDGASPGPDGLSATVYKIHWPLLAPLWVDMVREAEATGQLHVDVSGGLLILLPKTDEATRRPEDNRPITLLNVDYKILTALLTARLNPCMPRIIHNHQTGFISGRFIGDNVILTRDYLEWSRHHAHQAHVVFCDFQKAYDRVRWSWLWSVLQHVGLGDRFLRLVQACYASPVVTVVLEGVTLGEITPTRGVRQGCPLSPLLFALCLY